MKKKALYVVVTLLITACSANLKEIELINKPERKTLIVYFSESRNKNTQTVAEWIHEAFGGDIYEIEMLDSYAGGYRATVNKTRGAVKNNILPEIKPFPKNVADYGVVFIGSPIWHSTYAPPVGTFLAAHNFEGKTIVPFCTHGGGGAGSFYDDVKTNAKGANVTNNVFVGKGSNIIERTIGRGTKSKVSKNDVIIWLNEVFNAK
ncbi:MAG: NAD(P)H-dependent oxidoreductase [Leptospirales bacterium]|nr:NAD(P)H-dependent oxidoreductase [Leptospirales bacterium]